MDELSLLDAACFVGFVRDDKIGWYKFIKFLENERKTRSREDIKKGVGRLSPGQTEAFCVPKKKTRKGDVTCFGISLDLVLVFLLANLDFLFFRQRFRATTLHTGKDFR